MRLQNILLLAQVATTATLLAACGSGGDGGGDPRGGIGGTGKVVVVGPVTRFGSVVVNEVEFEITDATRIRVEDDTGAAEDDLKVGMVVKVVGSVDERGAKGTADSIEFDENVEGPIDAIDLSAETLVVLGQTVIAEDAIFDNATLESLSVGNVVEVSGQVDATGAIRATLIERKGGPGVPASVEIKVRGTVSNLDEDAQTFEINDLVVDYSLADTSNLPGEQPVGGQSVQVESFEGVDGGRLLASNVEPADDPFDLDEDADGAKIEGLVTSVGPGTRFEVDGQPVEARRARFEGGTAADIADNVKVEVEGTIETIGGQDVLVADTVEIELPRNVRIEATVESKEANRVTLVGIDVVVDELATQFDDKLEKLRPFGFADIEKDNWLEIRAFVDRRGNVVASRITREDPPGDPEDPVVLQGPVNSFDEEEGTLGILGVNVNTAEAGFEDASDTEITAEEFFGRLSEGAIPVVRVKGTFEEGKMDAAQVSIED